MTDRQETDLNSIRAIIMDVDGVLTDGLTTDISGGDNLALFTSRDGSLTLLHRDTATDSYQAEIGIDTGGWATSDDMCISFDWRLDFFDNNSNSDEILAGIDLTGTGTRITLSRDLTNAYPIDDVDDDEKPDTLGEWSHFEASIEELFPDLSPFTLDPYLYINGNGQGRVFQLKVRNLQVYEEPSAMDKITSLKTTNKKTVNFAVRAKAISRFYVPEPEPAQIRQFEPGFFRYVPKRIRVGVAIFARVLLRADPHAVENDKYKPVERPIVPLL